MLGENGRTVEADNVFDSIDMFDTEEQTMDETERVGGDDRGDDEWSVRGGGEERGGVRSDGEMSSRGGGNPDWRGEGDDERIQGSSGVSDMQSLNGAVQNRSRVVICKYPSDPTMLLLQALVKVSAEVSQYHKGCYLEKSYEIKCLSSTTSGKLAPFLSINDNKEVMSISLPEVEAYYPREPFENVYFLSFGSVRVKTPITSSGCGGKESPESLLNFTGTPFFIGYENSLSSNGVPFLKNTRCLTNSQNYIYGACAVYNGDVKECNGNGCCKVGLREHQQAIGIRIESNDSTTTREEKCRVAFLTVESYTFSNATNPQELFEKGYARLSLGWVIQTKNHSFVSSLSCDNREVYENTTIAAGSQRKCICIKSTIAKISYAHCACRRGYTGNVYDPHGCQDVNECKTEHISCGGMNTCVNTQGGHHCAGDKKKAILIGVSSGFGALTLVSGVQSAMWLIYSFGVVLAELITGDKPVIMVQNTREIISLAEHFRLAVKEKRFSDIRDARIKEDCKMEQVMAVANLAVKCMSSKGNKRSNMREICTELERISASPEDSHVQVMIDEAEEDEEEEVRNMVNRGDSLSVGLTAPACGIVASPSSSDAESLFPRPTW
ncbi:hypothetical protein Bca52824_089364 [Brassica carinata]|uniref:Wall-associated receptor kinase domain-containing protein n=1 Tax=Brassica carinata TaxID=52824 RepID=A0A8X7TQF1_BRACI|nr:hypothetical protein Bca52824_089364 [Brassica carinata]